MSIKTNSSQKPPEPGILDIYESASASIAAENLLEALKPQLERTIEARLRALFDAPPDLGALLDARAQLKAVYDMQTGLKKDASRGANAVRKINELLAQSA